MADPLDHVRLRELLGRGVGPALRLLPQVHPPGFALARQFRRGTACRDRRRLGHPGRSPCRSRHRPVAQELGVGLHRALEHAARLRLRPDRRLHARRRGSRMPQAMEALRLQNLKKSFGGLPAIADVSLTVAAGERRLIIGPNGAGKTTLFNLLTGDLPRDAGSIELFGAEVGRLTTHRRVHLGLARTYQIITLFPKDTLEHNIVLSLLGLSRKRWDMFGSGASTRHFYQQARSVLARVGLERLAQRPIAEVAYVE